MKRLVCCLMMLITGLIFSIPAHAGSILVYDDNSYNQRALGAVQSLLLPYTRALSSDFNTLLSGSWDLVVVDCPSNTPAGGWATFIDYLGNGGKGIMSFWMLQDEADLQSAFDVSVVSSFDTPQNVNATGHPIFNGLGNLTSWTDQWADDGDELSALSGADVLATFSNGNAAIVLGNGGRTIYNGFIFDELNDPDGTHLIANEITFLTQPVPIPGAVYLLGSGLVGLAGLRKRFKK